MGTPRLLISRRRRLEKNVKKSGVEVEALGDVPNLTLSVYRGKALFCVRGTLLGNGLENTF